MIDFDHMLFNIDIGSRAPETGDLLVAEPFMRDENFSHSVILLIEYSATDGAMGIVMNNQTDYHLSELINAFSRKVEIPVFCGGPLSRDRLYFLHTLGDTIPESRAVGKGLFLGGDFDAMTQYVNSGYPTENRVRFFVGYSGWSPGQLEQEIREHTWAVTAPRSAKLLLTGQGDHYWHKRVRALGDDYRGWRYHPRNPQAN